MTYISWFCLISWSLFGYWMSYFVIISHCDAMIDLIIDVDHSDLYFMVQWFRLIVLHWSPVMFPSLFFYPRKQF